MPSINVSDPANPIITVSLPAVSEDVWGIEIRGADNTTVIYHADLADAGFQPSVVCPGNTSRNVSYYIYTYNLLGEYSAGYNLTFTIAVPTITDLVVDDATKLIKWDANTQTSGHRIEVDATSSSFTHDVIDKNTADQHFLLDDADFFPTRYIRVTPFDSLGSGTPLDISHVYNETAVSAFGVHQVFYVQEPADPVTSPTVPGDLTGTGDETYIGLAWENYNRNTSQYGDTVSALMISGLTTVSEYVAHFVVECYSDSALTLRKGVRTAASVWDAGSSLSKQVAPVSFKGVYYGLTYYLRAGVVSPISGQIAWSSTYAVTVGTANPPTHTYTYVPAVTSSGVNFTVTAVSPPSNVKHYEAYWNFYGGAPASTQVPNWKGTGESNVFSFFVGHRLGNTIYAWVRAINTAGDAQAWFELGTGINVGSLDDVDEGSTYGKTVQTHLNTGRPVIDFSEPIHANQDQDHIADGAVFFRAPVIAGGAPVVENGSFESSATILPPPGWSATVNVTPTYETVAPMIGSQSLKIVTTTAGATVTSVRHYQCAPGEQYYITGMAKQSGGGVATLGIMAWDGSTWHYSVASTSSTTPVRLTNAATIPAGCTWFKLLLYNPSGTQPSTAWFDDITLSKVRSLDTEVVDGTTYARVSALATDVNGKIDFSASTGFVNNTVDNVGDGTTYKRTTVNEKTGADRGYATLDSNNQVANTFALKPINNVNRCTSGSALTQSGTSHTINISAGTIQWGAGAINYNSGSVTPGSYGTWYIYADDPQYSGGPTTYVATATPSVLYANDGRVYFGSITTSSAGGGSGGGSGQQGGGCPAVMMFVHEGQRVNWVKPGDLLDCRDDQGAGPAPVLEAWEPQLQPCVLLTAENGCEVVVSKSTPVTVQDGRSVWAVAMEGEMVDTDEGWSRCHVMEAGTKTVARVSLGGRSFAAGVKANKRVYTHNITKP